MNDSAEQAVSEVVASAPAHREAEELRAEPADAVLKRKTARAEAAVAAKLKAAAAKTAELPRHAPESEPDEVGLLKAKLHGEGGGTVAAAPAAEARVEEPPPRVPPARAGRPQLVSSGGPVPAHGAPARSRRAGSPALPTCRIEWWRGYLSSEFYAARCDADGDGAVVLRSPSFRWRKSTPPPHDMPAAAEAHARLVAQLEADGWIAGKVGADWYSLELHRRPSAAAARTRKGEA
jgi:hypothetical protein